MNVEFWYITVGSLLIAMVLISASLRRLSVSTAIIYLLIGVVLGNSGLTALRLDAFDDAALLTLLTEIAVIISLFTTGLKLRLPLGSVEWRTPLLLASVSMVLTIAAIACISFWVLHLSIGASVLIGAILAPTDPVLASSIQVLGPRDEDRLRFSLTAEAGLNDGTAFPFVMLGLGLLGLNDLGEWGVRWILIDLIWGVVGGLAVGTSLAIIVGKLIGLLRSVHKETGGYDDFLALGLISLSYGVALLLHCYGFLAVFAAGLALRRRERQEASSAPPFAKTVSGEMARSLLQFNEQMERVCELVVVTALGAMLTVQTFSLLGIALAAVVILVARPISILFGVRVHTKEHRLLLSWFGIRGLGSLYYLFFAIDRGIDPGLANTLIGYTFSVVVLSIFIHGVSSSRLMLRHDFLLGVARTSKPSVRSKSGTMSPSISEIDNIR